MAKKSTPKGVKIEPKYQTTEQKKKHGGKTAVIPWNALTANQKAHHRGSK